MLTPEIIKGGEEEGEEGRSVGWDEKEFGGFARGYIEENVEQIGFLLYVLRDSSLTSSSMRSCGERMVSTFGTMFVMLPSVPRAFAPVSIVPQQSRHANTEAS